MIFLIIPRDWGLNDDGNLYISRKASILIDTLNVADYPSRKYTAIRSFFRTYFVMNGMAKFTNQMNSDTAFRVFEYAVAVGRLVDVSRDEIEPIWKDVFKEEVWDYTANYFQSFRKLED
jgi:hypothetical protein